MAYQNYSVTIKGYGPLLAHNGQTANPLNPWTKRLKAVTSKRSKTEADHIEMGQIEFGAGLYMDQDNNITWDTRVLEAMVVEGARKTKNGKNALAGVFVDGVDEFNFEGPQTYEERLEDLEHCALIVAVKVGQAKVMRTRPIFREWSIVFRVSVNDEIVKESDIERWITDGGNQVGIGDWRPRYGRFSVEECKLVSDFV